MQGAMTARAAPWLEPLRTAGFVFLHEEAMRAALVREGGLDDWEAFAGSWNDLALDTFMADKGRYRRRRHAVFTAEAGGTVTRAAHQPHYQARDYNALNGGIERWFEPVRPEIADGTTLRTVLRFCNRLFSSLSPEVPRWHVELHQFRIEARPGMPGLPTPEGVHRDGVDHVLVLLVDRHNIARGTTTIHRPDGGALGSFTLTSPLDAALLDDRRVFHGVTAVQPVDPAVDAHRDVLVVTFRR